ncbi:hypothetical protein NQ176_g8528 [Zarea fungicola]|uniref:Uncharacterized protein n=1 Tax=Zarea fungicola TaxID=93591 RepID=A0ACC1MRR6_9HYPO|nr:hypothetical protein NQ176_g8528 [Lecanicillium fungicola]
MPPRKRGRTATEAVDIVKISDRPKRQRVSLACDACRSAREKCDGVRPQCGTCSAETRSCSYTPALRKRGIRTGYLRAVELSLAWVFSRLPNAEESLHQIFVENGGSAADQLLVSKGKASSRLYRQWIKGRIYNDIDKLLSEDRPAQIDTSTDCSDSEFSPGETTQDLGSVAGGVADAPPVAGLEASPLSTQVQAATNTQFIKYPKLPASWRRLVDIYFTYTHCWLPIVQQEEVYFAAMLYTSEGLQISSNSDPYAKACHAQLWAILAMGSFQDVVWPSQELTSPEAVYSFAKSLIPNDDSNHERPMICAMVLHTLILMGRGSNAAAWLALGRATRLILLTEQDLDSKNSIGSRLLVKNPTLTACFFLDTLLSICLGKPPHLTINVNATNPSTILSLPAEAPVPWRPMPGFGSTSKTQPATSYPSLTLYQLVEFSIRSQMKDITPENLSKEPARVRVRDSLVKCLHPQLYFCNSLNVGESMPHLPSALLLQVAFLASSILVSGYRASLLFTLLEIVELSIEYFGDGGTPPVLACYMESIEKQIDVEDMRPSDRNKWSVLLQRLRAPWQGSRPTGEDCSYGLAGGETPRVPLNTQHAVSPQLFVESHASTARGDVTEEGPQGHGLPTDQRGTYLDSFNLSDYSVQPTVTDLSLSLNTPSRDLHTSDLELSQDLSATCPSLDYDALLEELGSIDYTDSMELDSQFMANLGFAPGSKTSERIGDLGH